MSPSYTTATSRNLNPQGQQYNTARTRPSSSALRMSEGGEGRGDGLSRWVEAGKKWLVGVALASSMAGGGALLGSEGLGVGPALAATPGETKEIGLCLLSECRAELGSCLLNPK